MQINQKLAGSTAFGLAVLVATVGAQVGRGGSEWLTARADAQRTSWIRTDPKISVESMSKPGFELQWTRKLDNRTRQLNGLTQGVTANGVTLFVPMSVVAGSSNNVYALDNDTGYVVWQRHFDATMPAPAPGCPGGITAAATRIVPLVPPAITMPAQAGGGRAAQAYRSVIGEPGQGVPLETRGGAGRGPAAPGAAAPGAPAAGAPAAANAQGRGPAAAGAPAGAGGGRGNAGPGIPGAPAPTGGGFGRPSGVVYAISSDGILHVMGLPSGKDIQRPAEFMPANARFTDAIAVNTTLYTTTTGKCAGTPNGVWAIDLENEAKPVVSWKSPEDLVGALAFTTDGTVVVAKANAIVTLDGKTLQEKDSFTAAGTEFVTGPTVFRHGEKEIISAGTKDGRILLLDAASPGGANKSTPLFASKPIVATGSLASDAIATWQEMTISAPAAAPAPPAGAAPGGGGAPGPAPANVTLGTRWIVAPVTSGIVALKLLESGGTLSLEPGWSARNYAAPATPIIVNGVVFALSTGRPAAATGTGTPAVLRAYEGTTGKLLWDSKLAMKSFASPGSFWSALGQLYVGTNDGTLYSFGFSDERTLNR